MKWIHLFFKTFWELTLEMSPYLLLGFLIAGMLNGLFSKAWLQRQLGKPGLSSSIKAALFGVPLPLCSCGVIPTGVSLNNSGASKGATTSFLVSTPQTGIDSILITYGMMGWVYAIIRPVIAFVTGVFGGALVDKLHTDANFNVAETDNYNKKHTENKHWFDRIFKYAFVEFLQDISRWLIIGLVLASIISIIVPDDFFVEGIFSEPILSILLVLMASIPLYVCATGSVPIAAVLLMKGISPGAAIVFLMAGPATNIATFTVLWNAIGKRTTLLYLFTIILGALLFGVAIDYLLPVSWHSYFLITDFQEGHHHFLPHWLRLSSAIILILLVLNAEIKRFFPKQNKDITPELETMQSYEVKGMMCNHCVANVEKTLNNSEKVEGVTIDLSTGKVDVEGKIKAEEVKALIEGIGYEVMAPRAL